jgi:hypothetical protein
MGPRKLTADPSIYNSWLANFHGEFATEARNHKMVNVLPR